MSYVTRLVESFPSSAVRGASQLKVPHVERLLGGSLGDSSEVTVRRHGVRVVRVSPVDTSLVLPYTRFPCRVTVVVSPFTLGTRLSPGPSVSRDSLE